CRLRKTHRRGRAPVPLTFLRMRRWRRRRAARAFAGLNTALSPLPFLAAGLAGLAAHDFAEIPNPLPLVGLRGTNSADLRRDLANLLLVNPLDDNTRAVEPEIDSLGGS